MKAFTVDKYGKQERLSLSNLPIPKLAADEVLVQVKSAGVNLLDSLVRNGEFKLFLPYKPSFVLGHDLAGVVTEVGAQVTRFKVGDEVFARPSDFHIGAFAEFIAVPEVDLALKPSNLSMEEAASIPLVGLTAWQALVEIAQVKSNQKVFIQAGSGGVGTFAIQLAKHLGAHVSTTTSTGNSSWVRALGADVVIDYRSENFEDILTDYDVVLHSNRDPKVLESSLRILKPGGIVISLIGPPTAEMARTKGMAWPFQVIMNLLSLKVRRLAKKLGVRYHFLFMRADGKALEEISQLLEAGTIKPVVDRIFPFEETNEAMAYVESSRAKGKVVVKVS